MSRAGTRRGRPGGSGQAAAELVTRLVEMGGKHLVQQLEISPEQAEVAMRLIAHELCSEYGGQQVYVPQDREFQLNARDMEIWRRYTGENTAELALQFDLSVQQVYAIVGYVRRAEQRRRQGELPGMEVTAPLTVGVGSST